MVAKSIRCAILAIVQLAFVTNIAAQEEEPARKGAISIAAKELWTKEYVFLGIAEFSPDGRAIALGCTDGKIRVCEANNANEKLAWQAFTTPVRDLHPKAALLASTASSSLELKYWDLKTGQLVWSIAPHIGALHGFAFEPQGRILATWGSDKTMGYSIRLWDSETGKLMQTIASRDRIAGITFGPTGSILAYHVQYYENKKSLANLVIWNYDKGKEVRIIKNVLTYASSKTWLWFTADGKQIITTDITQVIQVWDAETGNLIRKLPGIEGKIYTYVRTYSQTADLLASVRNETKDIVVQSPSHPEKTLTLEGRVGHVALSPDGKMLANFMGSKLRVWQIETKSAK